MRLNEELISENLWVSGWWASKVASVCVCAVYGYERSKNLELLCFEDRVCHSKVYCANEFCETDPKKDLLKSLKSCNTAVECNMLIYI